MRFHGDVSKAGRLFLSDVTGELDRDERGGWFVVPQGGNYPPAGDYELRLSDGRSAAILLGSVTSGPHRQTVAHFRVNGSWQ